MESKFSQLHREITPLNAGDCLLVFDRERDFFTFPLHFHPEYELNFIANASGAIRVVGDHSSPISDLELVLVGPNLPHYWAQGKFQKKRFHELTIQFQRDLFHDELLNKNVMAPIKQVLNMSLMGIAFSEETIERVYPRLESLSVKHGFDAYIELLTLLFDLANTRNQQVLSSALNSSISDFHNSERIKQVCDYIENNYTRKISLDEIASQVNMTNITFSRFIKQRTGKTFVEFLNSYRISIATRLLIETPLQISEIAYTCGFNNLANFNKIFRKNKSLSPTEYRKNLSGKKRVIQ
ncbi:MAG TPA: AraC family transcriptional regulator [Bacteroidales bacterium]|nr:AraC family transcriptional regulator [Bacteroidales bacterium]